MAHTSLPLQRLIRRNKSIIEPDRSGSFIDYSYIFRKLYFRLNNLSLFMLQLISLINRTLADVSAAMKANKEEETKDESNN